MNQQENTVAQIPTFSGAGDETIIVDHAAEREANVALQAVTKHQDAVTDHAVQQTLPDYISAGFIGDKVQYVVGFNNFNEAIHHAAFATTAHPNYTLTGVYAKIDRCAMAQIRDQKFETILVPKDWKNSNRNIICCNNLEHFEQLRKTNPDDVLYGDVITNTPGNQITQLLDDNRCETGENKHATSANHTAFGLAPNPKATNSKATGNSGGTKTSKKEASKPVHSLLVEGRYDPEINLPRKMTQPEMAEFKKQNPAVAALCVELIEYLGLFEGKQLPVGTPVNIREGAGGYVVQCHKANGTVFYSALELAVEIHSFLKSAPKPKRARMESATSPLSEHEYQVRRAANPSREPKAPVRREQPKPVRKVREPVNSIAVLNALGTWRENYLAADPNRQFPAGMPLCVEVVGGEVFVKYHGKPDRRVESMNQGYEVINHFIRTASTAKRRDAVQAEQTKEE